MRLLHNFSLSHTQLTPGVPITLSHKRARTSERNGILRALSFPLFLSLSLSLPCALLPLGGPLAHKLHNGAPKLFAAAKMFPHATQPAGIARNQNVLSNRNGCAPTIAPFPAPNLVHNHLYASYANLTQLCAPSPEPRRACHYLRTGRRH